MGRFGKANNLPGFANMGFQVSVLEETGYINCPEYQIIYDAFIVKPDAARSIIYDTMVRALVAGGWWQRMDLFHFFANHINTAGEALINWKQPAGGASLMDAGKGTFDSGTESWIKYGNNGLTTELVDGVNALKLTYVDNGNGGYCYLKATGDLNTDLTVGKTYRLRAKCKVNTGSSVNLIIYNTSPLKTVGIITATTFTWYEVIFTSQYAIDHYLRMSNMSAGEILWIDEYYIQEWSNATSYNNPTHTADQGLLYDGATNYTMHNWIASVNGVNYIQNSASQILYIRTNIAASGYHGTLNNADTKDCTINPRNLAGDRAIIRTNDGTHGLSAANPALNGSGLYFNTRTAAAINKLYRNKVAIINGITASIGTPTHKPYTGAYDDDDVATGFRADQVSIVVYMDGCSQADVTGISDILNATMTSLGTNVY